MHPMKKLITVVGAMTAVAALTGARQAENEFGQAADFCKAGKAFGVKLGSPEIAGQHLSAANAHGPWRGGLRE